MALGKLDIFDSNWVDIVFKGRNHAYGAYVLRKKSDEYTTKGIIFAIVFFTLAISAPVIVNYISSLVPKEKKESKEVEVVLETPPLDKDQPPPPPPPDPPPLKSTVKFTPPEIKPDEEVVEPPPTQEEMKDKEAAAKTEEGDPNGVDQTLVGGDGVTGEEAPEILTFAEQMPEFEGGQEALLKYMQANTQYPPLAKDNGIEGRVVLSFVVGTDGKITNIEVLKKLGWGCEEEAVRVVKSMPPWKPGKQNGKPVTVKFTLPFAFKLQ